MGTNEVEQARRRDAVDRATALYESLDAELKALKEVITDRSALVAAEISICPAPVDEKVDAGAPSDKAQTALALMRQESGRNEHADGIIHVHKLSGFEAARRGSSILGRTKRRIDQSAVRTYRAAGVICVRDAGVSERVERINELKRQFGNALSLIAPHHKVRRDILMGSDLQHVHQIQAMRRITLLPQGTSAVTFGWTGNSRKVHQISAGELRDYLIERYGELGRWGRLIKGKTDDEPLAVAERILPTPIANVKVDGKWLARCGAQMPFICIGTPPMVRLLDSYAPSVRDRVRSDRLLGLEPLIPELSIYEYERDPEAIASRPPGAQIHGLRSLSVDPASS